MSTPASLDDLEVITYQYNRQSDLRRPARMQIVAFIFVCTCLFASSSCSDSPPSYLRDVPVKLSIERDLDSEVPNVLHVTIDIQREGVHLPTTTTYHWRGSLIDCESGEEYFFADHLESRKNYQSQMFSEPLERIKHTLDLSRIVVPYDRFKRKGHETTLNLVNPENIARRKFYLDWPNFLYYDSKGETGKPEHFHLRSKPFKIY